MIGTNRDLIALRDVLEHEIVRLQQLAMARPAPDWVERRLSLLARHRHSLCAVLVSRRSEAANKVVVLSRWFTGNGALRSAPPAGRSRHAVG